MLDLEDDPSADDNNPKVKELRQSAIDALKERDRLTAELATAKAESERWKTEKGATETGKKTIEEQLAHLTKVNEANERKAVESERRAREESFRGAVMQSNTKHKIRDDAASRVVLGLVAATYKEVDGKYVPQDASGQTLYSKTGAVPMPVDEYVEQLKTGDYKDLFSHPVGGGGRGSQGVTANAGPRVILTRKEAMSMNPEQFKAAQEGRVDISD